MKLFVPFLISSTMIATLAQASPEAENAYYRDYAKLQDCQLAQQKSKWIDQIKNEEFDGKDIFLKSLHAVNCSLNVNEQKELLADLKKRHSDSVAQESEMLLPSQAKMSAPEPSLQKNFFAESKEGCPVSAVTLDLSSRSQLQEIFNRYGYDCVAKVYAKKVYQNPLNVKAYKVVEKFNQKPVKPTLKGMRILIVPHFSYERGWMLYHIENGWAGLKEWVLPWTGLAKPTGGFDKFDYRALRSQLKSLGASVEILHRVSNSPLADQVEKLSSDLAKEKGPYAIFARSSGAIVLSELIRVKGKPKNFKAWFNLAGTPFGSHVPHKALYSLPNYLDETLTKTVATMKKAPQIKILPGVGSQPKESLLNLAKNALNLDTPRDLFFMNNKAKEMPASKYEDLQVVNFNFFAQNSKDFTHHVTEDLVEYPLAGMMRFGPSEGSSLIADMAIDTRQSVRVMQRGDHFLFRDYEEKSARAIVEKMFVIYQDLVNDGDFKRVLN